MEHPIIQIKNAITALLKGIDPDTDVFYEEIKGTEEKHGLDEPETYYFVDIIPNGNETVDRFFTDEFCPGAEMLPDYLIECPNIENQEEEE